MQFDFSDYEGADVAQEESKTGGPGFQRIDYLDSILKKDGDKAFIRYLTDFRSDKDFGTHAWITVDVHQIVPTKPKPASWKGNWPKAMTAMCRKHKVFAKHFPQGCYICQEKTEYNSDKPAVPKARTFAVAVLREESIENGRRVGFQDQMVDVIKTNEDGEPINDKGEVVTLESQEFAVESVPRYVIVRQAWGNYYHALKEIGTAYDTVLDRDFRVSRTGERLTTEYHHVAMDPIDVPDPDDDSKTTRFDLRDPRFRDGLYGDAPVLSKFISGLVKDEYFERWFIPQPGDDDAGEDSGGDSGSKMDRTKASAPSSASEAKEPSEDRMKALREKLKNRTRA